MRDGAFIEQDADLVQKRHALSSPAERLGGRPCRFGPRNIPHRFTVGPEGVHMIWVLTPGGFDDFVADVSVPADTPTVPPANVLPPEDAAEIVLRHGMELLEG